MTPEQLQDHQVGDPADGIVLQVLGRFSLIIDGVPQELPVQVQKVIAFLALHDGAQPRDRVAERVWPDADLKHCRGSLRTVLWRVRQVSPDAVRAPRGSIALGPSVRVDLHEGLAVAKRILDGRPVDPDRAIPLLNRRLLPDWDDEWSLLEQARIRQMQVHCLEILGRRLLAEGRYAYALQAAGAACRIEPLRESAQRTVIDILLAEGNHAQARRIFEDFRQVLRAELGIEPSAQPTPLPGARPRALEPIGLYPVASHSDPNPKRSGARFRVLLPGFSTGCPPASAWPGRQPSAG